MNTTEVRLDVMLYASFFHCHAKAIAAYKLEVRQIGIEIHPHLGTCNANRPLAHSRYTGTKISSILLSPPQHIWRPPAEITSDSALSAQKHHCKAEVCRHQQNVLQAEAVWMSSACYCL